jgi:hypothetical protein
MCAPCYNHALAGMVALETTASFIFDQFQPSFTLREQGLDITCIQYRISCSDNPCRVLLKC